MHLSFDSLILEEYTAMDFSAHNPTTSNALNLAARNNDVLSVKRLLKKINPNCVDNRGWTSLHEAAYADSCESLIEILKHRQCRGLVRTYEGYTPLYLACHTECSLKTIKVLLDSVENIANYGSTEGFTPLHIACGQGRLDLIQLLIEYGAELNVKDFDGDTPLHIAVIEEQPEAIETLINAGADPKSMNESGGFTPFHLACGKGCFKSVELLYPFVTDINQTTSSGHTALMLSVRAGNEEVITFLLNEGADPHIKNVDGEMALDIAVQAGHSSSFKIMFSATDKDKVNRNIILTACKPHYFKKEIVETLLTSELGPEYFDFYEEFYVTLEQIGDLRPCYKTNAPLNSYLNISEYIYETFPECFVKFFNLFLKRGVSVNAANKDQCPPLVYLHYCLHYSCFEEMFKLLVQHGCNVDYCTADNWMDGWNCTDKSQCIPDAFLASMSSRISTLPIMLPFSLCCDPDTILNFTHRSGILGRIQQTDKAKLMSMIDVSFRDYEAEKLAYYVPPLKHLCRAKIRTALRNVGNIKSTSEFLNVLSSLPLPPVIRAYLRYS